jgi:hypothetical protein
MGKMLHQLRRPRKKDVSICVPNSLHHPSEKVTRSLPTICEELTAKRQIKKYKIFDVLVYLISSLICPLLSGTIGIIQSWASDSKEATVESLRWTSRDIELLSDNGKRYEVIDGQL